MALRLLERYVHAPSDSTVAVQVSQEFDTLQYRSTLQTGIYSTARVAQRSSNQTGRCLSCVGSLDVGPGGGEACSSSSGYVKVTVSMAASDRANASLLIISTALV